MDKKEHRHSDQHLRQEDEAWELHSHPYELSAQLGATILHLPAPTPPNNPNQLTLDYPPPNDAA